MEHEASLHDDNCFITLTYDDDHLPDDKSLHLEHWTAFRKKLYKRYGHVRFYHVGEYGERFGRPHYHSCLFGFKFDDQKYFKTVNNSHYYTSDELSDLWGRGFCISGDLTFESAAYCARYVTKKVTGYMADFHYSFQDADGNWCWRKPEYATMTKRPDGIGADWFRRFGPEVWNDQHLFDDFIISRGHKVRVPRYYEGLYELDTLTRPGGVLAGVSKEMMRVKGARLRAAKKHAADQSPERLKVREKVQQAAYGLLKRGYDENA